MEQPNKNYVNQSLVNQIANFSLQIAERDAVITELSLENQQLKKELEELRAEQIKEMDNAE